MTSAISPTSTTSIDLSTTKTSQITVQNPRVDEAVPYEANGIADAITPQDVAIAWSGSPRDDLLDDERALLELGDGVQKQLASLRAQLASIPDRQGIVTAQVEHLTARAIPTVERMLREAEGWMHLSTEATTDAEREELLARAKGMILGAMVLAQAQSIQYAYLAMANAADDAGYPSSRTVEILASVDRALAPLVEAALTFDPEQIDVALAKTDDSLAQGLVRWRDAIEDGAELSRKGIAAADAALIVLSIYQVGRAVAGISLGGPGLRSAGGGGAAIASGALVTEEVVAAIRRLVQLGALDVATVSGGVGPGGATPAPMLRDTPSGTVVPTKGPLKGRTIEYEDPRNKHTRVAEYTMEQILQAVRNPKKARGALRGLVRAIENKDTKYYGSQLSREATDMYEALVRDAVENGTYSGGKAFRTAKEIIGISVETGRATTRYRVDMSPTGQGAHVVPL